MSVAISSAYQLNEQKPNLPEKRHLVEVAPTSANPSSASPIHGGATIEFLNLPTSASAVGSYISTKESYIKVKCRATMAAAGKTCRLPKTGFMGCVEDIRVTSSGYVVEDSKHHNLLTSFLRDMTEGDRDRTGVRNRLEGTATKHTGAEFTAGSGAATEEEEFCIPLLGQFWNSCEMLPCHAITDLAYRLTLASDNNCLVTSTAGDTPSTFDVTGFTLHLCYVEVSPESRSMLTGRTGMNWSSPAWEVIRDNLGSVGQETLKVPSAKSSMKTLSVTFQHSDADNSVALDADPAARTDPGLAEYQWNVNGELYPRNPVEGNAQMLQELMRSFHEDRGYNTQITEYAQVSGKNSNPASEHFAISVSLESHGKSQSSYSGASTLTQNPMVIVKSASAFTQTNVHYMCQFDQAYRIENGVVRVSY